MMNFDRADTYVRSISAPRSTRTRNTWNPTTKVIETASDSRVKGKDRYVRNESDILKPVEESAARGGSIVPPIRGIRRSPARSHSQSQVFDDSLTPRMTPGRKHVQPSYIAAPETARTPSSRKGLVPPSVTAASTAAIVTDCLSHGFAAANAAPSKYERGAVFFEKRHVASPKHAADIKTDRKAFCAAAARPSQVFTFSPVQQKSPGDIQGQSRFRCRPAAAPVVKPRIDATYKPLPPYAVQ